MVAAPDPAVHSHRRLRDPYPDGWVLYVSNAQPERLVVFVHGFRGRAIDTWQRFPESGQTSEWWRASDMLFVGYDSVRDTITGVAARLRRELCAELGVTRQTLYRHVSPTGELRPDGLKLLATGRKTP